MIKDPIKWVESQSELSANGEKTVSSLYVALGASLAHPDQIAQRRSLEAYIMRAQLLGLDDPSARRILDAEYEKVRSQAGGNLLIAIDRATRCIAETAFDKS